MKKLSKILSVVLVLAMIMGMAAVVSAEETATYTQVSVSKAEDITAGKYLIYGVAGSATDDGSTTAFMTNESDSNNRLKSTQLTITDGTVTTAETSCVWELVDAEGGFYLKSADGKYVSSATVKKAKLVSSTADATILKVVNSGNGWTLQSISDSRLLTANRFGSAGSYYIGFAFYASASQSCPCTLTFYKLNETTGGDDNTSGGEGGTGSEGGDTPSGETVSAGLLTSNEKLTDGAKVIIANVDGTKAMGAYFQSTNDDKNYRTVVDVTKDSNKVTGSGIAVLTVEVNNDGTYSLKAEDGYIAAAEKGNYLNTNASKDDLACWNISIYSDGTACIVTTGNAASPLLQYNGSGNSARFTGYKTSSGQQFVNIYLVNYEGDTPVAISATPKANIAEIRTTKVGDVASVKGVVTYVYYKYIYIQDDNATLKVCFTENATCSRGDVVSVSGIVYSDGSLINATATPSDGMTLTATDCAKIADLVNIDEGRYVKLSNLTVTEIKKNDKTEAITGYVLSDGTDTISVSLDGCEVELEVGAVVNVQTANTQLLTIVNASEIAVVTPGSGSGSTTTPEKPVETVKAPAVVASPVAGTAYKFGYYQANKDKTLWSTGEMAGYYMATTDKWSEAADVYTETTDGGVYLYFMSGTTKTYINLVKNGNYTNFDLSATAATVYTYNTQYKYFSAKVGEDTVYLGTYKDYETMSASNVSYIEDASVIGKSQFLACMYEMTDVPAGSGSNPDTGDTTISLVVAALVVSALGMTAMVAKKKEF